MTLPSDLTIGRPKSGNVNTGRFADITFDKMLTYTYDSLEADNANHLNIKRTTDTGTTWTYTYLMPERTDGLAAKGITAETPALPVTVTITDGGDGKTSIDVAGLKKLAVDGGDDTSTPPDVAGKFTFTLTADEGTPMPKQTEVKNDKSGTITFGVLFTFTNTYTPPTPPVQQPTNPHTMPPSENPPTSTPPTTATTGVNIVAAITVMLLTAMAGIALVIAKRQQREPQLPPQYRRQPCDTWQHEFGLIPEKGSGQTHISGLSRFNGEDPDGSMPTATT